jgi:hypothetical protein
MKHKKNFYDRGGRFRDDEDEQANLRKQEQKRRPIRNWTKIYTEHADEVDDLDEFYGK